MTPGSTLRRNLLLLAGGSLIVTLGWTYAAVHASAENEALASLGARMQAARRVAIPDVAAHEGEEIAVRGWAAGTPRDAPGGRSVKVPVVYCEDYVLKSTCGPRNKNCTPDWRLAAPPEPPVLVIQADRPTARKLESEVPTCRVDTAGATFLDLQKFGYSIEGFSSCLRADAEITVFGRVTQGEIRSGDPFVVASQSPDALTSAALADPARSLGSDPGRLFAAGGVFFAVAVGAIAWLIRIR